MRSPFAYSKRVAGAALSFAVFGALMLLLGFLVPLAQIRRRSALERELRAQRVANWAARFFMALFDTLGVVESRGRGLERLAAAPPQLVVANHPTLIDVLALLSAMPQADLIVNVARAENPLMRGLIRSCGYLRNDNGPATVAACVSRIRAGRSLIVFPEGTRSPRGGLRQLQRGAAHIALRAPCDLLPVLIRCDPPAFGKGQKWYDLPDRAVRLTLEVGEPISPGSVGDAKRARSGSRDAGPSLPVAARRLTAQLREALEKGLETPQAREETQRSQASNGPESSQESGSAQGSIRKGIGNCRHRNRSSSSSSS